MYLKLINYCSHLKKTNKQQFWRDIKLIKGKIKTFSDCIDEARTPNNIAEKFNSKFQDIFDDQSCQIDKYNIKETMKSVNISKTNKAIYKHHIHGAIDSLNCGIGFDKIHSNHFKYAKYGLDWFLSRLFSAFLSHSYIPKAMLKGEIRPLVKDRFGDLTSLDNYRPVMISSNFLKLFEYCLLPMLESSFKLNFRQFGFRRYTSTSIAVMTLREIIY